MLFCSDDKIRALNRDFRGKDSTTDVLSFELGTVYEDEDGNSRYAAGDIAVSVDFLFKNAADFKVSPDKELKRLLIFGRASRFPSGDSRSSDGPRPLWPCQPDTCPPATKLASSDSIAK